MVIYILSGIVRNHLETGNLRKAIGRKAILIVSENQESDQKANS